MTFGRYGGPPSREALERFFFLNDRDRKLVFRRRGDHNRLGFSLQLTTARFIGRFLPDPLDGVPTEVIDYLAEQLGIADPSCVKRYAQREPTHREHAGEIQRVLGLRDFAEVAPQLAEWVDARAWVTGDGPKAIFADAVVWLRERDVLLPGVSTLARLVARVREEATRRVWATLDAAPTAPQRVALDALLVVAPGSRVSKLERWRTGPTRASGPQMVKALKRVADIRRSGLSRIRVDPTVSPRRLAELARYGIGANVAALKRHGGPRQMATLVATVARLEATATDDALELLDLFMTTELIGPARKETDNLTITQHPKLARASAMLVVVAQVLLDARERGPPEEVRLAEVWDAIEDRITPAQVRAAAYTVSELVPPPEALPEPDWRAQVCKRIASVTGFVKMLTTTIDFGATLEGAPVLAAMGDVAVALGSEAKWTVRHPRIHPGVVPGPWKHLVFGHPAHADGRVDRAAYTMCLLEVPPPPQAQRNLRRGLDPVAQPASTAARGPSVGGGQRRCADLTRAAHRPRRPARRARRHPG